MLGEFAMIFSVAGGHFQNACNLSLGITFEWVGILTSIFLSKNTCVHVY